MADGEMEGFEARLRRFLYSRPHELISTLLNSIHNFLAPEIRIARENHLYQLVFLGTHAIMQTVCESIYGRGGDSATKFFLKEFVDGDTEDMRFSVIASELHDLRNITAHQWLSKEGHAVYLDTEMNKGWLREGEILRINPNLYAEQFMSAFNQKSAYWEKWRHMPPKVLRMRKFQYLVGWMKVSKLIEEKVRMMTPGMEDGAFDALEEEIVSMIEAEYGVKK